MIRSLHARVLMGKASGTNVSQKRSGYWVAKKKKKKNDVPLPSGDMVLFQRVGKSTEDKRKLLTSVVF